MPLPGNITIIGEEQGQIEGSCDTDGREGTIQVLRFDHSVEIPTSADGITAGRRVHRPFIISKETDKSTPMLFQALCTGELLSEVILDWYRIDGTGEQELYYTIKLYNALISKVRPWVPDILDQSKSAYRHMEDVSFTYEKIIWTWEPDGIEYEDAWGEMV